MEDILERVDHYWRAAGRTGLAHYISAEAAAQRHKWIGIPSVALSAVVATSVFSTLSESVDVKWRIATGVVALAAAILASLQAFLSFGERADKHKAAGSKYGAVRRKLDLFRLEFAGKKDVDRDAALARLTEIADELGNLASESPSLAGKHYDLAREDFDRSHATRK